MEKDLISVIVPVFKVENYLEKCVDSITNQTYKNLEIILVDDGSPDNCPKMCDEYAKKDERIKVIHKANGGLSEARNYGIEALKGKYITFVDSDDYLNLNFVKTLHDNLVETKANMSIVGFKEVFENSQEDLKQESESEVLCFDNTNKFQQLYLEHKLNFVVAWGKLYERQIFENLKFPVGKFNEDEFVAHLVIDKCKKICFSNKPYYYYLQRANSIMHMELSEKHLDVLEALENRINFFENNLQVKKETIYSYISTVICKYYKFKKPLRKILLKKFNFLQTKHKNLVKTFSFKRKLKIFLFKYFRVFYKIYFK